MESHKLRIVVATAIALAFVCGPMLQVAVGHTHWHCSGGNLKWPDEKLNWRAGKNSFPSGSTWRTALTTVNGRWNQAPGEFVFGIRNWGEKYVGRSNGQNEIWFSDSQSILDGAPAVCYYRYNCAGSKHKLVEADVIFDADVLWSRTTTQSNKTPYGGSYRPWGCTAIHEMGHALGLAHEDDTYNVMGQDWDHIHANNDSVRWYVGEDAGHGEVHLYGQTDTTYKNDLGVSHWKHSGASGEYSTHTYCRMYHTSGSNVSREDFDGWKRYKVKAGQSYKAEFTFENNGYYDKSNVHVGHYISTNDYITTSDDRIAQRTMTLNRNKPYTTAHTVTIPADLTVGQTYYLGVIVDYTGSITEFSESNNATWLPIRIVP